MAVELGWQRRFPFQHLTTAEIERLIQPFAAGARVHEALPLSGGLRNSNYRVRLSSLDGPIVLRLYSADPSACRRETALARLVHGRVPTPEVLHAEPDAEPPWAIVTFVEASRFDDFLVHASVENVAAAARSAGGCLASIHAFQFPEPGYFGPDLQIGPAPWPDIPWSDILQDWLVHGRARAQFGPDLSNRLMRFISENAGRVDPLRGEARLVHADYKPWNLLVKDREIAAVLDWEGARSGSRLVDLGIFLRYSATQTLAYRDGFIAGYTEAGGDLPADWPLLIRLIDLLNLCYFLERPEEERPEDDPAVLRDVRPLIETTLADFAP